MATDRMHGSTSEERNSGTRPIEDISTAVVGMVCTAPDADPDIFPLNKPVLMTSISQKIDAAGSKGTLYPSLEAIQEQTECRAIIVRVQEGSDEAETVANIVGSKIGGVFSGLQAFDKAINVVGELPGIIGIPGFDDLAITTELATKAEQYRAFTYASCPEFLDIADAVNFRKGFSSKRLMLIDGHFTVYDSAKKQNVRDMTIARILGLRAKIDAQIGWHKTISNVDINGVVGIEYPRSWGLSDKNSEANFLNNNDITTLIRDGGFQAWGNRTTSSDPLFSFENYTRTGDIIIKTIESQMKWAIDKPMSIGLMSDICAAVQNKLDQWTRDGKLFGAKVWVEAADNTTDEVKNGKFTIRREYTPVPPLEHLHTIQTITDRYIVDFVSGVVSMVV